MLLAEKAVYESGTRLVPLIIPLPGELPEMIVGLFGFKKRLGSSLDLLSEKLPNIWLVGVVTSCLLS